MSGNNSNAQLILNILCLQILHTMLEDPQNEMALKNALFILTETNLSYVGLPSKVKVFRNLPLPELDFEKNSKILGFD